ncbi:MAG: 23S rRNA (guanosine(2251)-2'-O)-methyltransferase RlmB, partial [Bacteroidia bacterium]
LKKLLRDNGAIVQYVPVEKLNRLTRKNHQGVAGFVSLIPYRHISDVIQDVFEKGEVPLILILDRITDVRNFGAIARSAECAGAHAVVITEKGSASVNADAVKTSAGALNNIPVCKERNLKEVIDYLKNSGLKIVSCSEKGDKLFYESSMKDPVAIIMGSEEDGVSDEYLKRSDEVVKIPMMGAIGSLNVSVASGIILFETIRQRQGRD